MLCEQCYRPLSKQVIRSRLCVSTEPPVVIWDGSVLIGFAPAKVRILSVLARLGSASTEHLVMACLREDAETHSLTAHICQLRKVLPHGLSIETIWRWGYKLIVENDDG